MASIVAQRFYTEPYWKMSKLFLSETCYLIESKLEINNNWMAMTTG
jgi:hypothetical protein